MGETWAGTVLRIGSSELDSRLTRLPIRALIIEPWLRLIPMSAVSEMILPRMSAGWLLVTGPMIPLA